MSIFERIFAANKEGIVVLGGKIDNRKKEVTIEYQWLGRKGIYTFPLDYLSIVIKELLDPHGEI